MNESQKLVHWNNLMRDGAKEKQHQRQTESESVDMCTYNGIQNWEFLQKNWKWKRIVYVVVKVTWTRNENKRHCAFR